MDQLGIKYRLIKDQIWIKYGSNMDQKRLKYGSNKAQIWIKNRLKIDAELYLNMFFTVSKC